jgi:hypothetical protein
MKYTLLQTKCADCPQGWKLENLVAKQVRQLWRRLLDPHLHLLEMYTHL